MPALRPVCWILGVLGLLIVGCSGSKGDATSPITPTDPLAPGAIDPLVSPDRAPDRAASNVIEGEVILAGSASGSEYPTESEVLTFPVDDPASFKLIDLRATALDGTPLDPSSSALARVGHQIGAYSTVPMTSGVSNYPVVRTGEQRLFARHFPGTGSVTVQLTNRPDEDGPQNIEPVKWSYRIAAAPDPDPWVVEVHPGQPIADSLSRGVSGRRWRMRRNFRMPVEPGVTYQVAVKPLVAPQAWRWNLQVDHHGYDLGFSVGSVGTVTYTPEFARTWDLQVWVDVPDHIPAFVEVGTFELEVKRVLPPVPSIRRVIVFTNPDEGAYYRRVVWPVGGVYQLKEHTAYSIWVLADGGPCEASLGEAPGLQVRNSGNDRRYFRATSPGQFDTLLTASNAVGESEPFLLSYEIAAQPPQVRISTVNPKILTPEIFSTYGGSRITHWAWDFGPNAIPTASTEPSPSVTFTTMGSHEVTLTTSNETGTTVVTTEYFMAGSTRQSPLAVWTPFISGKLLKFQAVPESMQPRWYFPDADPSVKAGVTLQLPTRPAGLHKGLVARTAGGGVDYQQLHYVVNPAETNLLSSSQVSEHEVFQVDPKIEVYDDGEEIWLSRPLPDQGAHGLQFFRHSTYPGSVGSPDWTSITPLVICAPCGPDSARIRAVDIEGGRPFVLTSHRDHDPVLYWLDGAEWKWASITLKSAASIPDTYWAAQATLELAGGQLLIAAGFDNSSTPWVNDPIIAFLECALGPEGPSLATPYIWSVQQNNRASGSLRLFQGPQKIALWECLSSSQCLSIFDSTLPYGERPLLGSRSYQSWGETPVLATSQEIALLTGTLVDRGSNRMCVFDALVRIPWERAAAPDAWLLDELPEAARELRSSELSADLIAVDDKPRVIFYDSRIVEGVPLGNGDWEYFDRLDDLRATRYVVPSSDGRAAFLVCDSDLRVEERDYSFTVVRFDQ